MQMAPASPAQDSLRPAIVEMGYPWFQNELQVVLIQRKEIQAFTAQCPAFGARTGVCYTRTPTAVTLWSNSLEKMLSWSCRTNRYE